MKTRADAYSLLVEHTNSETLIAHALATEACMRWYAKYFKKNDEEIKLWGLTGLLYNFDYEKNPLPFPPDGHPFFANRLLGELGYPAEMREAIMANRSYTNIARTTRISKTLFACSMLSEFVTTGVHRLPDRSVYSMTLDIVKTLLEDAGFARSCCRYDMECGAKELDVDYDQHISNVIEALKSVAKDMKLDGQLAKELEHSNID